MITVLILEDNDYKLKKISELLVSQHIPTQFVKMVRTVYDAECALIENLFDLLILDINVPLRQGEDTRRHGGLTLLRNIKRKGTQFNVPDHIVGITAYQDIKDEVLPSFDGQWHVLYFDPSSDDWEIKLTEKLSHISAAKQQRLNKNSNYQYDVAIVTALETPELAAVRKLPLEWKPPHQDANDSTIYHEGYIPSDHRNISVIAASACAMGMPHATVLASKMISHFKPRYLWMLGICAGIEGDSNLGDIVFADHCWDYGSGKYKEGAAGEIIFEQQPSQYPVDPGLKARANFLATDLSFFAKIKDEFGPAPVEAPVSLRIGPMASGAAVVSSERYLETVRKQNRKLTGLEMEAYGVMCAGVNSRAPQPQVIIAKSVCDFANAKKGDKYQPYAAYTSAKFFYYFTKDFLFARG
ncbi:MAG: hypothetical protein EPN97_02250 [Alphaproteobacteria bacterium]|nr:MAG: hypothetical protein EPN97_02250 [Alphaproteobacteria bacterium]